MEAAPRQREASTALPAGATAERLDLIDAVVYGDLFDCAVTEEEAWRYSRLAGDREHHRRRLEDPRIARVISRRNDLYCLAGREQLLALRPPRRRKAVRLFRRARWVARILQHFPFVRGLLLTGSAAADDARPGADVDLLVIVRQNRLSVAFTLLGGLSRLLSRRLFCPNHYLSDAHLQLTQRHDLYLAREVAQARALAGDPECLARANAWVRSLLPNAARRADPVRPLPGGRALQRLLEWPLRGQFGDRLDRALRGLTRSRLEAHHRLCGTDVPREALEELEGGIQLRFHGSPWSESVASRYEIRRREIAAALERG